MFNLKLIILLIPILFLITACEEAFIGSKPEPQLATPANVTEAKPVNITVNETVVDDVPKDIQVFIPRENNLTLYFLDIKGDSTIVHHRDKAVLIDSGFKEDSEKVLKSIRDLGIDNLDYVFATNTQPSRIGGMPYIILRAEPDNIIEGGIPSKSPEYTTFKELYNKTIVVKWDTVFEIGDFFIKAIVIYDDMEGFSKRLDDNSLITKVQYGSSKFLLMSDCGMECEERLKYTDMSADVIKISSSCNATSLTFIQRINPEIAIVSTQDLDQEFCPNIIERFKLLNIPLYITSEKGDIFVTTDGLNYNIDWKK